MDRINELLEKYFQAHTSLAEEQELKQYFTNGPVAPEHQPYCALFEAFEQESQVRMPVPVKEIKPVKRSTKRLWLQISSFSGIAAMLLVSLWILGPQEMTDQKQSKGYALVNPPRNEDNEFARKFTKEKLEKVNEILNNGMKPMKNLEKVRTGLQPINKISETREKLQEIQNKLQFK